MKNENACIPRVLKKKCFGFLFLLGIGILTLCILSGTSCKKKKSVNAAIVTKDQIIGLETQPIAEIDGEAIPIEQFNSIYAKRKDFFQKKHKNISEFIALMLKKSIVTELVNKTLVLKESKRMGLKISDSRLKEAVIEEQNKYPDKKTFDLYVNNLPGGMEQLKDNIRLRLLKRELTGIKPNEPVSEADIKKFFDNNQHRYSRDKSVTFQEIVFPIIDNETEAQVKMDGLHDKITKQDISFSFLARNHSKGPSAKIGGYRGRVIKGSIPSPLWNILQNLEEGEVSPVIKYESSFYILRLIKNNPPINKSLEKVRDEIVELIRNRRHHARMGEMIHALRSKHKIENHIFTRYQELLKRYQRPTSGSSSISVFKSKDRQPPLEVKESKDIATKGSRRKDF